MNHTQNQPAIEHRQPQGKFALWTVIASAVAAMAAWASAAITLEVWIMFAGFIAWFTRPTSLGNCMSSMLCLWFGLAIGAASEVLTGALMPSLGQLALPLVVFLVALLIVGSRTHRVAGNMLAWFLGMVTWFAAGFEFSVTSAAHLIGATLIGGFAGFTCQTLNRRWAE